MVSTKQAPSLLCHIQHPDMGSFSWLPPRSQGAEGRSPCPTFSFQLLSEALACACISARCCSHCSIRSCNVCSASCLPAACTSSRALTWGGHRHIPEQQAELMGIHLVGTHHVHCFLPCPRPCLQSPFVPPPIPPSAGPLSAWCRPACRCTFCFLPVSPLRSPALL